MRWASGWLLWPLSAAALMLAGCGIGSRPAGPAPAAGSGQPPPSPATSQGRTGGTVPQPRRTVIVIMENHSYDEIIGNPQARYINYLARHGALFTRSFAITHPSEPNYLALFSGSTHGIRDDGCPYYFRAPNLGASLIAAGKTFAGYSEDLPATGSLVCSAGEYARKHVPWANFPSVPASASRPLQMFPGSDPARLPAVSFVIPDLCHDMHDCGIPAGDAWLRAHLSQYASWALTHDSLLIVTWDEDDGSTANQIPTIFLGQVVRPGRYTQRITHYSVLRTIEDAYRLRPGGYAATAKPITGVWERAPRSPGR